MLDSIAICYPVCWQFWFIADDNGLHQGVRRKVSFFGTNLTLTSHSADLWIFVIEGGRIGAPKSSPSVIVNSGPCSTGLVPEPAVDVSLATIHPPVVWLAHAQTTKADLEQRAFVSPHTRCATSIIIPRCERGSRNDVPLRGTE